MSNVLGVDLDTRRVTLAMKSKGGWDILTVPACDSYSGTDDALKEFAIALDEVLWSLGNPSAAYIEKPFLSINPTTFAKLASVYTCVRIACASLGIKTIGVPPATWQNSVLAGIPKDPNGTKKKASKNRSIAYAKLAEGVITKNDHEADALCIAVYAEAMERQKESVCSTREIKENQK